MEFIGYARVSTVGQSLETQLEQLRANGSSRIFKEKISGVQSNRPELTLALDALRGGDTLVVTRLDRLARSTRDLLDIVDRIESKGASLKSITDAWADTVRRQIIWANRAFSLLEALAHP